MKERIGRVTTGFVDPGLRGRGRNLEFEEATGIGDAEGLEDLGPARSGVGSLGHATLRTLHGHQVHAVEFATDVAPAIASLVLDNAHGSVTTVDV